MAQPWLSCLLLPALVVSVAANVAPKFLPNMTVVILPEDLPLDAEAFWLVAEDQDNDPLTYGISGSNAHFFNVTANTGQVRLASPLDFETLNTFSITISVTDDYYLVSPNVGGGGWPPPRASREHPS
nr:cadherin-related family member 2-like isoform X2 [Microcebus murinus]